MSFDRRGYEYNFFFTYLNVIYINMRAIFNYIKIFLRSWYLKGRLWPWPFFFTLLPSKQFDLIEIIRNAEIKYVYSKLWFDVEVKKKKNRDY